MFSVHFQIVKIFNCIDTSSSQPQQERRQIAYYERGIGSVGNVLTKAGQGLTGSGIDTKIKLMYLWLGVHWKEHEGDEEDRLFLFGFSRGAFAVRSLLGMIYRVGLLDLSGLDAKESDRRVCVAYEQYQKGEQAGETHKNTWAKGKRDDCWLFHGDKEHGRIPIHFLGVFDTVGQLGVPRESWWLWVCCLCYFKPGKVAFHDVWPNETVRTGRHAVAIDEMRSTFQPVFSRSVVAAQRNQGGDFKQVWFPGCHSNVGGGVLDSGLSDGALKWMVDEAAKVGLRFQQNMLDQIKPNFQGNIFHKHGTRLYKNLTFFPRSVPAVIEANCTTYHPDAVETVHISAIQRSENPRISQAPYFTTTYLQVGETFEGTLKADKVYNSTYVYLEAGATYDFAAEGMWGGFRNLPCGPQGYGAMAVRRHPRTGLMSGLGQLERGCRTLTGNLEARLPLTRRHDHYPWHSVMGMITCGGTRNVKSEADFHTVFGIGESVLYQVGERGGYLYCYANDTWSHYSKNKGTMALTIKRIN